VASTPQGVYEVLKDPQNWFALDMALVRPGRRMRVTRDADADERWARRAGQATTLKRFRMVLIRACANGR
jgi:hypothetical protein